MGRRVLMVVGVMCAVLATLAGSAAAARWSAVQLPLSRTGDVDSLSCVSARACFVLGNGSGFMRFEDGRLSALPDPHTTDYGPTDGLACPGVGQCLSVGDEQAAPASAARFRGGRWSGLRVPTAVAGLVHRYANQVPESGLTSVACPSRRMCVAVGGDLIEGDHGLLVQRPMIERWNGTRWSAVVPRIGHLVLTSVSCSSPRACTAVGDRVGQGERSRAAAIAMRGRRWRRLPVPALGGQDELSGVSCRASGCVAVGGAWRLIGPEDRRSLPSRGLVLTPAHGRWTARRLPAPVHLRRGAAGEDLAAVSCPAAGAAPCVAVGHWMDHRLESHGVYATIGRGGSHQRRLGLDRDPTAIDCPTATFCLAGGNEAVERWHR
jgi:hypothetical protein